ncbi:DNA-binding protein, partial [Bacillus sp. SRB_28]
SFIKEFPRIRGKQFDWNALVAFKLRWKISLKMCIFRATSLGLLTQEQARTGYIHLNSKGYTKVEPGDGFLKSEEPNMFSSAIDMLDDATWLKILAKTGLSQELIRDLFSVNRPLINPRGTLQLVR